MKRKELNTLDTNEAINVIARHAELQREIEAGEIHISPACGAHGGTVPKQRCIVCIAEKVLAP